MNTIDKIVVGTDLTENASAAVKAAALLAEKRDVPLVVVHVIEKLDEKYDFLVADIEDKVKSAASSALTEAMEALGKGRKVKLTTRVEFGSPFEQIGRVMLEEKADLLVVGTGEGGGSGYLGPVASKAAHKLPYDMLFVNSEIAGMSSILVATDFSDCSQDALERAAEIASAWGTTEIPVVHAYEIPAAYYRAGSSEEEVKKKILEYAKKHFSEWVGKIDTKGVKVTPVFVEGNAAKAIIAEAAKRKAELVVVGTHGRTSSASVLIGSIAERVVRDASCAVWAERKEGHAVDFLKAITRIMGL